MIVLSARDVDRLLTMSQCIDAMDAAHRAVAEGAVAVPLRTVMATPGNGGHFLVMPGASEDPCTYGAKLISLHPGNPRAGRPAIQGFVVLFDHETGEPLALIEGARLTAIRTAAVSGLATRALARPDARSHGLFGTGVQAHTHLSAIKAARPGIREVFVWGRSEDKARAFAAACDGHEGMMVRAVTDPAQAARADVVSAVTAAASPVLEGAWLRPGAHVNLVGAHRPDTREADTQALARARVYVDVLASARAEAGDLLIPIGEGAFGWDHVIGEIGDVLVGRSPGRSGDEQITLYKSLGMVAQDLFAGWATYRAAREAGAGTRVVL